MAKKLTQEDFIDRCLQGNPNLDYSKVIYQGTKKKVIIICPKHGEFNIIAGDFLKSFKCPKCSQNIPTTEEFIERCKVHYPNYDYSETIYTNKTNNVIVKCPKHNCIWEPMAQNLERGQAMCPECKKEKYQQLFAISNDEFIEKAKQIHQNKYDYSKCQYINMRTKIIIICPIHGEFEQDPNNHLKGCGCPKCKRSKGEEQVSSFLKDHDILFQEQYIIPYNNKKILVDFYLPNYNTFIEFNGKQHYIAMDYFGGTLRLEQQQARDQFLREYCVNNNINLIEIKYNQSVEDVLKEKLTERRDTLRNGTI